MSSGSSIAMCHGESALYPRLLGDAWRRLPDAVRSNHLDENTSRVSAQGVFSIQYGDNWLARRLAWLARMPAEDDDVETRLVVSREGRCERWFRTFGKHEMTTWQRERPGGRLGEWFGCLELRFRLNVEAGALSYSQTGAYLSLGRLSLPLPRRFSPQVTAKEEATGAESGARIEVEVSLPVVGMLIRYTGQIQRERSE